MTAPTIIHGTAAAPFDVLDDWDLAPPPRASLARPRDWRGTALQVAVTLAVAVGSYALSLGVSAERAAVTKLQAQNRAMASDIRSLDAELRVRMRLPQLQRWNDEVLGLQPVSAAQFVADASTLGGQEAEPRLAIAEAPLPPAGPVLASAPAPQRPAGLILASTGSVQPQAAAPAPRPVSVAPAPVRVAAAPVRAAPQAAATPAAKPVSIAAAVPPKPKPAAKAAPAAKSAAPEPSLDAIGGLIAAAAADERRPGGPKELLPGARP